MAPLTVRNATREDAAALSSLLETLGYPATPDVVIERLRALQTSDRTGRILVAVDGSAVLGFLTLHLTPTLHRETAVGRITGIAVHNAARGRGVGGVLVAAAEQYFREQALGRAEVTSGPTHEPAHDFYRHLGYVDQGVRFAKRLDAAAPTGPARDSA
jgi:ribosomal protein S18 acetylase RimI-like enzyme